MSDMQLNNKKGSEKYKKCSAFDEKTAKSPMTFRKNKPNSPIVQTDASLFTAMIYAIFTSLTKVKNKPNQTQYKANSNPIVKRPKINVNPFNKMICKNFMPLAGQKNKPKQTQFQTWHRPPPNTYLHHSSLKIYPKNASFINKLLIYTRFLIDNSIVSFTRYKDCEVYLLFKNGEGF